MWIAEWSPDSGVEDSECFETEDKSEYFCDLMNKRIGEGKGTSAYWYNYLYKPPVPVLLSDALERHGL